MKKLIAILIGAVTFFSAQAQLAEFDIIGFEDSRFTFTRVTMENGEVVSYFMQCFDEEDGELKYSVYDKQIHISVSEPGNYIITQRHNNKDVHLTIIVPEEGLKTKKSYRLRRRNVYIG